MEYFDNSAKALGILFMKFGSQDEMIDKLRNINKLYRVITK